MDLFLSVLGLTALQIVLGIDNVLFLSIVTSKLEVDFKKRARRIGIFISMIMNTVLILSAGFLANMHEILFTVLGKPFNVHDLLMVGGGFFLVYKAVKELYHNIEGTGTEKVIEKKSMTSMLLTMTAIDFLFSIDSTITAIGMSDVRWIQLVATLSAVVFMFFFFNTLNNFIERHPSFKILALAFLVMIGFSLFVDGMGIILPKGYVYSMMVFAVFMEILNIRFGKNLKNTIEVPEMVEIEKPIGDFIINENSDIKHLQLEDGAYYHYADVCKLLNRLKKKLTFPLKSL